jgi:uncharacterized protein with FMN-binding domain
VRARAAILASAASAGIILLGWQAGTGKGAAQAVSIPATSSQLDGGGSSGSGSGSSGSGSSSGSSADPAPGSSGSTGSGSSGSSGSTGGSSGASASNAGISGTFKGTSIGTRFGSVQVQVTISKGVIADVAALQLTDRDNRSVAISNRAAPVLRSEVLAAQSADVQTIGGATYTCEGYLSSLQAALDSANFQSASGG